MGAENAAWWVPSTRRTALAVAANHASADCSEEPGTADEIAAFYVGQHGLPSSSLMERADVNGPNTQDVYRFLRSAAPGEEPDGAIEWNFTKFLVGRDGQVLGRYGQGVKPSFLDERLPAWLA